MIEKHISTTTIKEFIIDYENGIFCKYTTKNNKLDLYFFYNEKNINFRYVENDNLQKITNSTFSQHHKYLTNKIKTIKELKNFNMFNKLFYVGDGLVKDINNNLISTTIILDDIFSQIYLKIEKKFKKCQNILNNLNKEYITYFDIVEIPNYNINTNKKHHYTIYLHVKIPNNKLNEFVGDNKYIDDQVKMKIFNYLKIT